MLTFLRRHFPGAYNHSHSPDVYNHSVTPLCLGSIKPSRDASLSKVKISRDCGDHPPLGLDPAQGRNQQEPKASAFSSLQAPAATTAQPRPSTCPSPEVHPHSCHPSETCFPTADWLETPWTPAQPRESAENAPQRGCSDVLFAGGKLIGNAKTFAQTAGSRRYSWTRRHASKTTVQALSGKPV